MTFLKSGLIKFMSGLFTYPRSCELHKVSKRQEDRDKWSNHDRDQDQGLTNFRLWNSYLIGIWIQIRIRIA